MKSLGIRRDRGRGWERRVVGVVVGLWSIYGLILLCWKLAFHVGWFSLVICFAHGSRGRINNLSFGLIRNRCHEYNDIKEVVFKVWVALLLWGHIRRGAVWTTWLQFTIIWHIWCMVPSSGISRNFSRLVAVNETEALTSIFPVLCSVWPAESESPVGRIWSADRSLPRSGKVRFLCLENHL